jgi:hypothetical protein
MEGIFWWKRVPMGLKGAPGYFQRAMVTEVLKGLLYTHCEVYLDDIIVFGATEEEYLANLEEVFKRLEEFNITINPDKCKLGLTSVEYVGHTIDRMGHHFTREKLLGVLNFAIPRTATELMSFIGLTNYFRAHVRMHSDLIKPLEKLIDRKHKGPQALQWTDEARTAFEKLKTAVYNCPKLFWIDDHSPVHVFCDASDIGMGVYICQMVTNPTTGAVSEVPIAIASKTFTAEQRRWQVRERECFPIVWGLRNYEYLLRDIKFTLHTDHENLIYIKDSGSAKVMRWKLEVQQFDFKLVHIKGKNNVVADAMSRNTASPEVEWTEDVQEPAKLCELLACLSQQEEETYKVDILASSWEAITIPSDKYEIIRKYHNTLVGHHGINQTVANILENTEAWPYMRSQVTKFIHQCDICQRTNEKANHVVTKSYTIPSDFPFERVQMDLIGPLNPDEQGNTHILVVVDCFSRFLTAYPIKGTKAAEVAEALLLHAQFFGFPCEVSSDRGREFVNGVIQELLGLAGAEEVLSMAYSKAEQSIVERANKEIGRWLRIMIYDRSWSTSKWSTALPFAVRIHNNSVVASIGCTPNDIILGWRANQNMGILLSPEETKSCREKKDLSQWMEERRNIQNRMVAKAKMFMNEHRREVEGTLVISNTGGKRSNKDIQETDFPINSYVLVAYPDSRRGSSKPDKLLTDWRGPYQVEGRSGNICTIRNLVTGESTNVQIHLLKQYQYDPKHTDVLQEAMKGYSDYYVVDRILSHSGNFRNKASLSFRVRWKGYGEEDDTNEPWENVRTTAALHTYLKENNLQKYIPERIDSDTRVEDIINNAKDKQTISKRRKRE